MSIRDGDLYPGLAVTPPIKLNSFKYYYWDVVGLVPHRNYWYLDALSMLSRISRRTRLSRFAVNLDARPQLDAHLSEDLVTKDGDQVSSLYRAGWAGLNFELSEQRELTEDFYKQFGPARQQVVFDVFPPAAVEALRAHGVREDFDFLKIDVDSFVCDFLERILVAGYKPKVILAEVNVCMVPPLRFTMRYSAWGLQYADFTAAGKFDGYGFDISDCSLRYADDLLRAHGYSLVQFPLQDGWWVRREFESLFGNITHDPVEAFRMGNPCFFGQSPYWMQRWFGSSSPTVLAEASFMVDQMLNASKAGSIADYVLGL